MKNLTVDDVITPEMLSRFPVLVSAEDELPLKLSGIWSNVFLTYANVFTSRFIPWLEAVEANCRSPVARQAVRSNLLCEIHDDHPSLLRKMISSGSTLVSFKSVSLHARLTPFLNAIDQRVSRQFHGLVIVTAFELASLHFVPWMQLAAKRKRARAEYTRYLDVHGEADREHADQLVAALHAEAEMTDDPDPAVSLALVQAVIKGIFCVRSV